MKCAAIDIGTNTILLLIADIDDGFQEILDISSITRLGEGLHKNHSLSDAAMARALTTLKNYCDIGQTLEVRHTYCVGTSALRDAENSPQFLEAVEKGCGISVQVISGEQEAYLTYLSVKNDPAMKSDQVFIIDIGGGSTEMVLGNRENLIRSVSLPMGTVKLTEMFIKHDPPLTEEIDSAKSHIRSLLGKTIGGHGHALIGTGGSITNLAAIKMGLKEFDKDSIHGFTLSLDDVDALFSEMKDITVSQRRSIPGMEKGREDILAQGALILHEIMSYTGLRHCTVSTRGVRHGLLYERCFRNH